MDTDVKLYGWERLVKTHEADLDILYLQPIPLTSFLSGYLADKMSQVVLVLFGLYSNNKMLLSNLEV